MDFLQLIAGKPEQFKFLIKDEKIPITGYDKIFIDFDKRVSFRDGNRIVSDSPLVSYVVKMDSPSKLKMFELFKDRATTSSSIITMRTAAILLGKSEYLFEVKIWAIPDVLEGITKMKYHREYDLNNIKVEVAMENVNVSLYEDAEQAYKKYRAVVKSRFEIMDIPEEVKVGTGTDSQ